MGLLSQGFMSTFIWFLYFSLSLIIRIILHILSPGHNNQTEVFSSMHLNTWQSKGGWYKVQQMCRFKSSLSLTQKILGFFLASLQNKFSGGYLKISVLVNGLQIRISYTMPFCFFLLRLNFTLVLLHSIHLKCIFR